MRAGTPREIGLLIRERRQDLRLSQAELSARAGVGREWLVAVEKGHARAELGKVLAVTAELGLLLDLSADPASHESPGGQPQMIDLDRLLAQHDENSRRTR